MKQRILNDAHGKPQQPFPKVVGPFFRTAGGNDFTQIIKCLEGTVDKKVVVNGVQEAQRSHQDVERNLGIFEINTIVLIAGVITPIRFEGKPPGLRQMTLQGI